MAEATVATQLETLTSAAQGCAGIVAATALHVAARSVAEKSGISYVFAPLRRWCCHHADGLQHDKQYNDSHGESHPRRGGIYRPNFPRLCDRYRHVP
jgi:hypothetical protein